MADSASIQILLNASGNLGSVLDASTGKVLRLGKAAKGAGDEVKREAQQAAQGVASLGEQAARAFGTAGSSLAKFAGPLGALGGIAATAGFAISKALELAQQRFSDMVEQPVRLAEALQEAAKAAKDLAQARDGAILGNVSKLGAVAEPLVAAGGERALALARRISLDSGVELDDVAKAVRSGGEAGMHEEELRRLVEGAKLVRQSGRMSWDDAISAGIENRPAAESTAPQVAADMVNRAAMLAHRQSSAGQRDAELAAHNDVQAMAAAEHDRLQQQAYDAAQADWNRTGQVGPAPQRGPRYVPAPFVPASQFAPPATDEEFADIQARLASSPVVGALEAKRRADASTADYAMSDVENRGREVVERAASAARVDRKNPGLRRFVEGDVGIAGEEAVARARAEAYDWMGPFNPHWGDVKKLADKRSQRASAFAMANPDGLYGREDAESPEAFLARTKAERARTDAAAKAAGIPFGTPSDEVTRLLAEIARNTADRAPAPLQEAQ